MTTSTATQMAREIAEQPTAVRRTLDALLPLREAAPRPRAPAAGGCCSRPAGPATTPRSTAATCSRRTPACSAGWSSPSVATHYRVRLDLSDAVVVSVSQSGATEEIVATQAWARDVRRGHRRGRQRRGLAAGRGRRPGAGHRRPGPSSPYPRPRPTSPSWSRWPSLGTALAPDPTRARRRARSRVPDEVARLLATGPASTQAVAALRDASYAVVSGRGLMLGTALETALKLEETCLRPVRGYSYADLRHGPISVVTAGMTAVLVAAPDGPLVDADDRARRRPDRAGRDRGRHRRRRRVRRGLRRARARPRPARDARPAGRDRPGAARRRGAGPRARPRPRQPAWPGQGHHHRPRH